MKIPRITLEAVEATHDESISPESVYRWIQSQQPDLFGWAVKRREEGEPIDIPMLIGMAFTLRCLNHMPEDAMVRQMARIREESDETGPNGSETSHDQLFTLHQVEAAFCRTVIDYPSCYEEDQWIAEQFPRLLKYFLNQLNQAEEAVI